MTKPRSYQTEAFIIRKTKLGEADRILTLYTPHLGKIQGFAKGVRRPKSKLSGHLELLTHSQVTLARGKNIDTIIGSQTINGFLPLKSDLGLASYALYIIELVNQFTAEHVEDKSLFDLLIETMNWLCLDGNRDLLLRYFELHLLSKVGYRPQLEHCVLCQISLKSSTGYFCPSAGGILCPVCSRSRSSSYPVSINGLEVLRLLQKDILNAPGNLNINDSLSVELERIMKRYIKFLLEKDIKSAAWLEVLKLQSRKSRLSLL
ncbi:MAG TPA: DNA repair protein RecO [Dehalococcoidia bacterium]|nr:DNA repair protein RecO [Dehalococcoidia bacterium]